MTIQGKSAGLALSGGGFRATLYSLGSLWRLNEAGLLGGMDRISAVSGGSILLGVLASRWSHLRFVNGQAQNFEQEVVEPVRAFCRKSVDVSAALWGALTPFRSAGEFLADKYDKELFKDMSLKDLPAPTAGAVPEFVFYATNMQTGRSFRMRQDYIADWKLGVNSVARVPLATAVAASSAFPPVFSPVILKAEPRDWTDAPASDQDMSVLQKRLVLADGGVYDNMGLETLVGHMDMVFVSDAGAPFATSEHPPEDVAFQLGRVRDILIDQTRALRKRWFIERCKAGMSGGAYWGIGTDIADYKLNDCLAADNSVTCELENVPTRLSAFEELVHGRLINWGYAQADAAIRAFAGVTARGAALPVPEAPLQ